MNFLSMEYFMIIVEEGSFSRASGKLYVSQQSLSEHVKKLESEIGTSLLVRGRTLSLTQAGEYFYNGCKEMLNARDRMMDNISGVIDSKKQVIHIGVATYDTPPYLSHLLSTYTSLYPNYEVDVVKRQINDVGRNMNGVNLLFAWMPLDHRLEHVVLKEDSFVAILNKKAAASFYGEKWNELERELIATGNLALLKDMGFIMLYDRNHQLARDLDIIFKSYEFFPKTGFKSENGELNLDMCIQGAGVMIYQEYNAYKKLEHTDKKREMGLYKINTPGIRSCIALSYEKEKKLNLAERRFIEVVKDYISKNGIEKL